MANTRVTVSLDEDARAALDNVTGRTGFGQSEVVRRALTFYAANFDAARTDTSVNLSEYHEMISGGEHVLLDVDFLHCFLDYVETVDGEPDPEFVEMADTVSDYHAYEYEGRYESLGDLLEWLSLCGFLTVRTTEANTYHVVFPTDEVRWFMTRFVERSTARLPFDIEIEEGVTKVLMTEQRHDE